MILLRAQLTSRAGSITWSEYWSAQKPGSSGMMSTMYTQMNCCHRLRDSDDDWAGAKDCVCRPIVNYRTIHACALSSACTAASRDIANARAKIVAATSKPVTQACSKALSDAICSYHFWGCSDNFPEEVYNNVCLDVCAALENSCRFIPAQMPCRTAPLHAHFAPTLCADPVPHANRSQFGFDVSLSNFTRGMFFHRGCKGFNGTAAQDCTRPSPASKPLSHAAINLSLILILLTL